MSITGRRDRMWYNVQCTSTNVQWNKVLIHATRMSNANMLREESQSEKSTYYMILFIRKSSMEKLTGTESSLVVA